MEAIGAEQNQLKQLNFRGQKGEGHFSSIGRGRFTRSDYHLLFLSSYHLFLVTRIVCGRWGMPLAPSLLVLSLNSIWRQIANERKRSETGKPQN